ncbi:MAG TPA: DUF4328 domain-containing protein [Allosphingosinicella sp.]|nr:DUF4328 domain-containing protein [Allosphingosinicella sp.]
MSDERAGAGGQGALASAVRWLLWANAAIAAIAIAIVILWLRGFDSFGTDAAEQAFAWAEFGLFVGTAIAFLVWLYRAKANARALGAGDMMVSPGWAVGWYFVPLANLVMPFTTMRELWQASARPRDWQLAPGSPVIPVWWACWLGSSITGNAAFLFRLQQDREALFVADFMALVSTVLTIPSALALAWIVGRIQAMQESPSHIAKHFS